MKLKETMQNGAYDVKNTFWLQSQRDGFSSKDLTDIKKAGGSFPVHLILFWSLLIVLMLSNLFAYKSL